MLSYVNSSNRQPVTRWDILFLETSALTGEGVRPAQRVITSLGANLETPYLMIKSTVSDYERYSGLKPP